MQETEKRPSGLKELTVRYLCDPVLMYTVVTMMSIMYHYRDKLVVFYGALTLVIGVLLFRVFDYMMKHKLIGSLLYITVFTLFVMTARVCIEKGAQDYPLPFAVWFITPQVAIDYNKWYTMAIYLLFMVFMSSVIYYFTRVRYRIFMGFLVFIIPFAIYGKENEVLPIIFIVLMSLGYILLMIYFRQLNDSGDTVVVERGESWKSVGVYALAFAAAAALIPKPEIKTDRSVLESMISAEQFTDRLVGLLSAFRDTSSGGQYRDVNNVTPLYYANAMEGMHLKTSTYTFYDYDRDSWNASDLDKDTDRSSDEMPLYIADPTKLITAIMTAAEADNSFAEEYGLDRFAGQEIFIPEDRDVTIYSVYGQTQYAPVPEGTKNLKDTSYSGNIDIMKTGLVRSGGRFERLENFTFTYMADEFFTDPVNIDIINVISDANYKDLLRDASDVLADAYYYDADSSDSIIELSDYLWDEYERYSDFDDDYLDYGGNSKIYDLAMKITEGLDTDYEKARAIEIYFFNNGYIYDLEYVKSRGENVENFLFNTKRGVCFEYATAMVLLARAAGIPARYCEGFNMSQPVEGGTGQVTGVNFVITPQHAHGYPELYINGYGWTYFEPTIANEEPQANKNTLAQRLMFAGFILLGILIAAIILILTFPMLAHRFFLSRSRKRGANDTVKRIMRRICRIYSISGTCTSHEVADRVHEMSGADISTAADLFDAAVYGGTELSEEEKNRALEDYISAYRAYRETRKKRRMTTNNI